MLIYKILILLYLIYCMQFSPLHHKKDVLELEEIQKGKKMTKEMDYLLYGQILNRKCVCLEKRRWPPVVPGEV